MRERERREDNETRVRQRTWNMDLFKKSQIRLNLTFEKICGLVSP